MQRTERIIDMAGHTRGELSVCLGCRICASVCTVNDLGVVANPQDLLSRLFLGQEIVDDDSLLRYCTSCYLCVSACPWKIQIPDLIRATREVVGDETRFCRGFKKSLDIWGRVYEPYVLWVAAPDIVRGGYLKHMAKWWEYASLHLPHRVKRLNAAGGRRGSSAGEESRS